MTDSNNKVFCTFPWLHIHIIPNGKIFPCCNTGYSDNIGVYKDEKIVDLINSEEMKKLRYNMMNNIPSDICNYCYKQEEISGHSGRTYSINLFGKEKDQLLEKTLPDGTITDFQMKYYDIRFSNICNMKCRTCSPDFSSSWGKEINKTDKNWPIVQHADNNKNILLNEVINQIKHTKVFYFAGGEPLLTEEHYIILDKLIEEKITDIKLIYNTNLSNFTYKNKHIFDYWKNFKTVIVTASIDHYGKKAEYIRNGASWDVVESNLIDLIKISKSNQNISLNINSVLSIFNYPTLKDFYTYIIDKGLPPTQWTLHKAFNPSWYMAQTLPKHIKEKSRESILELINFMKQNNCYPSAIKNVVDAISFVEKEDKWEENKILFLTKVSEQDKLRKESFVKTFPELKDMYAYSR